jgi:type I site-specific restriction-modification system R (restriction) subunit
MLDLLELERRLDEALENETSESLVTWLTNQRNNIESFFGEGCIEEYLNKNIQYICNKEYTPSGQVGQAGESEYVELLGKAA